MLSVSGMKFFDNIRDCGGRSAIDLVVQARDIRPGDAILGLWDLAPAHGVPSVLVPERVVRCVSRDGAFVLPSPDTPWRIPTK